MSSPFANVLEELICTDVQFSQSAAIATSVHAQMGSDFGVMFEKLAQEIYTESLDKVFKACEDKTMYSTFKNARDNELYNTVQLYTDYTSSKTVNKFRNMLMDMLACNITTAIAELSQPEVCDGVPVMSSILRYCVEKGIPIEDFASSAKHAGQHLADFFPQAYAIERNSLKVSSALLGVMTSFNTAMFELMLHSRAAEIELLRKDVVLLHNAVDELTTKMANPALSKEDFVKCYHTSQLLLRENDMMQEQIASWVGNFTNVFKHEASVVVNKVKETVNPEKEKLGHAFSNLGKVIVETLARISALDETVIDELVPN